MQFKFDIYIIFFLLNGFILIIMGNQAGNNLSKHADATYAQRNAAGSVQATSPLFNNRVASAPTKEQQNAGASTSFKMIKESTRGKPLRIVAAICDSSAALAAVSAPIVAARRALALSPPKGTECWTQSHERKKNKNEQQRRRDKKIE